MRRMFARRGREINFLPIAQTVAEKTKARTAPVALRCAAGPLPQRLDDRTKLSPFACKHGLRPRRMHGIEFLLKNAAAVSFLGRSDRVFGLIGKRCFQIGELAAALLKGIPRNQDRPSITDDRERSHNQAGQVAL